MTCHSRHQTWEHSLKCHDSMILFSFYAYLFLFFFFSFTYGCHVTYLVIGSHVGHMMGHMTYHMTWTHDQSRDHGLLFFSHMSHYDSLIVFHLFLLYDSLYLISDSCGSIHIYDSVYLSMSPYDSCPSDSY